MKGVLQVYQKQREYQGNVSPLLNGSGDRVTEHIKKKKAEVLNVFSALVLPSGVSGLETSGKIWDKEDMPSMEEDQVREYPNKLGIHKLMGCTHWG